MRWCVATLMEALNMSRRKPDPYGSMFLTFDGEHRFHKSAGNKIEAWAEENRLECKRWDSIGCIEIMIYKSDRELVLEMIEPFKRTGFVLEVYFRAHSSAA